MSRNPVTSEILDGLPPHDLNAERMVLGSLIMDARRCDDLASVLRPEDFYVDAHRKLFQNVMAMHDSGQAVDVPLLVDRLKQVGEFEAVGGAAIIAEVAHSVAVSAHAKYYAEIVARKARFRRIIHATTDCLRDAFNEEGEPSEVALRMQAALDRAVDTAQERPKPSTPQPRWS